MVGHRLFECPAEAAFETCGPFSCRSESTALRSRAFRRMELAQPLLGKRCHSLCSQFRFGPVHRSSDNGTRASEHLQHLRRGWLDFLHLIATSASATIFASDCFMDSWNYGDSLYRLTQRSDASSHRNSFALLGRCASPPLLRRRQSECLHLHLPAAPARVPAVSPSKLRQLPAVQLGASALPAVSLLAPHRHASAVLSRGRVQQTATCSARATLGARAEHSSAAPPAVQQAGLNFFFFFVIALLRSAVTL